ncbi:uncharacterized protein [Diadema setosum]|uniref:uncharacterized protein n=1 Tax=Diadema setosum TaxID=31175 RepID=UPI003B3A2008
MAAKGEQRVVQPKQGANTRPRSSFRGKKALTDDNDNIKLPGLEPEKASEELKRVKSRLRSVREAPRGGKFEAKATGEENVKGTMDVDTQPQDKKAASKLDDISVVGSPILRNKLSSHLRNVQMSVAIADAGAGLGVGENGFSPRESPKFSPKYSPKMGTETLGEGQPGNIHGLPGRFIFERRGSGRRSISKGGVEAEEPKGKNVEDGPEGDAESAKKPKGITRKFASIRFKSKSVHKADEGKENNAKDSKRDKNSGNQEEGDPKGGDMNSKFGKNAPSNKEMVKELASFKFKGGKPLDEGNLRVAEGFRPKKALTKSASLGDAPKNVVWGDPAKKSPSFNRKGSSVVIRVTKPSQRDTVKSEHEYDLIGADRAGPSQQLTKNLGGTSNESDSDSDSGSNNNLQIPMEEGREYAVLCPLDEDEGSLLSSQNPATEGIEYYTLCPSEEEEGTPSNELGEVGCKGSGSQSAGPQGKYKDHVYEDIQEVMANLPPPPPIEAYQVSHLASGNIETAEPLLYDRPALTSTFKPPIPDFVEYDQPLPPKYPPSRESSWNHGDRNHGDQNQSQPSVTRNNWAVRLPEGSGTTFKGGYDQSGLGQKGQTRQGGSTPHSPTTTAPSQDDVPQGWRIEQTVTGDPVFINESTSEKWYKATPSDGDPYFYSEDRSKTCWELPAVVNSRRRMVSDSDRAGGDDSRLPSQSLRPGGDTRPARPFSFHPHLAPSPGANLPSESRFLDKSEMKRKHNRVSVYSPIVNEMGIREKEGILTLLHTKDKSRARKTRPGHGVLAGSQLKHYKDSKHYEKDGSNPDITISLWKANIFWTKAGSKPSKRLQFELQAEQGSYLLQGEDEVASNSWFEAIKAAISGQGSLWHSSPSPDDINDIHSPVSHEAHAVKKSNIREKLKSFMIRRPEKDELKRKGILQDENVFGKHIIKLCDKERTLVPNFVSQCIATIDKRGLMCDGIYRVSGNLSMIQKLRFQVDQEKPVDLETSPWKEDIHVITGALKLYFRELPEPLFTFATFDRFIASITKIPNREQKIKAFQELIRGMPPVNRETIRTLFSHLKRVMDNVQHNRMPAKNLATVFGPTLMWPERESMNMTMATVYQNQVMEFVLLEYDHIF